MPTREGYTEGETLTRDAQGSAYQRVSRGGFESLPGAIVSLSRIFPSRHVDDDFAATTALNDLTRPVDRVGLRVAVAA